MKDASGDIIYVGKAKKLKNRVSSYFHGEHLSKVSAMVSKVADFEVIIVSSEFEALVLENSLIKKYKPHYNILLKDDKGYPFIRIDIANAYPDINISPKKKEDGALYFGPFGGRKNSKAIITEIKKALLLPDCSRKFPRDIGSGRACLNYHLRTCAGWCMGTLTQEDYRSRIDQAAMILQGKTENLITDLTAQMEKEASELNFEKAAELRDRISLIKLLANRQMVLSIQFTEFDAVGFARGFKSCFTVLSYSGGTLVNKHIEMIDEPIETDEEAVFSFMTQYYTSSDVNVPRTILTPYEFENAVDLERLLEEHSGHPVKLLNPKRGDKRTLLDYAVLNSQEEINRVISAENRASRILNTVMKKLDLDAPPKHIEAYDISNIGNTGIVAAMTVFKDGRKSAKDYRKFRLKDQLVQNDYESMSSCMTRRFTSYLNGEAAFAEMPDLILVDGGIEHARAAKTAINELGLDAPVFGMVKDDRHRTRALTTVDGREVEISREPELFAFIGGIQEETHRSAIEYQRKLRSKQLDSVLDNISGIGEKRKNMLISRFKSVKAVSNATVEELRQIIPADAAQSVYSYFHEEKKGGK